MLQNKTEQKFKKSFVSVIAMLMMLAAVPFTQASGSGAPKAARPDTKKANAAVLKKLNFADREDFRDARRGFIAAPESAVIKDDKGNVVWDLNAYGFLKQKKAPETVNPSLWRQARLNMIAGLFKVVDHVYQVRGLDMSDMTIIEGRKGVIVIDPLISTETARAAIGLYYKHRGKRPVMAVIYTHSHVDHWGGVKGVVDQADVKTGRIKVLAPEGFLKAAISENVYAGAAMGRRSDYWYGMVLPRGPRGQVDAGLGKAGSLGHITLIPPTDTITRTGQKRVIDGVEMVFQLAPDTEAPAEMTIFSPSSSSSTRPSWHATTCTIFSRFAGHRCAMPPNGRTTSTKPSLCMAATWMC